MPINADDRATLLSLARAGVESAVLRKPAPEPPATGGIMGEQRGCFVTLTNQGHLRGCIGTFSPDRPLGQTIIEMGRSAARDPRFIYNPITATELPAVRVEISVLSPLKLTDEPECLEVGRDGIYIIGPEGAGCFLPEVATDMGWDAREFLDQCCAGKAGLAPGAWRRPEVKVYLFTSEKFGE